MLGFSGATAHEIVLLGGEVIAGRHQDLVHGVSAGRRRCRRLLPEITAGHHGQPETSAGHHHHLLPEITAGHHRVPET